MIWMVQNHFGPIEGQGIGALLITVYASSCSIRPMFNESNIFRTFMSVNSKV